MDWQQNEAFIHACCLVSPYLWKMQPTRFESVACMVLLKISWRSYGNWDVDPQKLQPWECLCVDWLSSTHSAFQVTKKKWLHMPTASSRRDNDQFPGFFRGKSVPLWHAFQVISQSEKNPPIPLWQRQSRVLVATSHFQWWYFYFYFFYMAAHIIPLTIRSP